MTKNFGMNHDIGGSFALNAEKLLAAMYFEPGIMERKAVNSQAVYMTGTKVSTMIVHSKIHSRLEAIIGT